MGDRAGSSPASDTKKFSNGKGFEAEREIITFGFFVSERMRRAQVLAIDEADMLDQENRDLLAGMILDTAEEFDQALVFTTVGDVRPENPGLPGMKMFWVEEGTVREI